MPVLEAVCKNMVDVTHDSLVLVVQLCASDEGADKTKLVHVVKLARLQVKLCTNLLSIVKKKAENPAQAQELVATPRLQKAMSDVPEQIAAQLKLKGVLGPFFRYVVGFHFVWRKRFSLGG